jgi:beta-N-acetylhexosaminidase
MRLSSDPAARRRLAVLAGAALVALIAGLAIGSGTGSETSERPQPQPAQREPQRRELEAVDRLSLVQQVGQLTISSFPDRTAPDYVRRRLRAGQTAGVILFGFNATTPEEWRGLTRSLQRAAGGDALVLVDQEGGEVRSVGWAGPQAAQSAQGDPAAVRSANRAAAEQLRGAGVNVNLAPVADVPSGAAPALGTRTYAGDPTAIAASTRAAIEGMRGGGVAATPKHFPGLGAAQSNTDDTSTSVEGDRRPDLVPFRAAVEADAPLVMLSHALYPDLDRRRIASQSPAIATGLLRRELGYHGVVVTDSLEAQAVLDRSGIARAAERSIRAGADLILMTGSASWNEVHPWLIARARASPALRERIRRSAARVLALKATLELPAPD